MNDFKKQLGNKIKKIRKARNITQEQLAEMIEIGTPNVSYIENGKFAPSVETLQKIATALEVEPWELYKFSENSDTQKMKKELFSELDKNEKLLKIIYQIFLSIKFDIK